MYIWIMTRDILKIYIDSLAFNVCNYLDRRLVCVSIIS